MLGDANSLADEKPKEEPEEQEIPRPQIETVASTTSAPQEAKAPPPVEAPPAEKAVGPKQGVYPGEARDKKEEGVVVVWFSLDRSGKVITGRLDKSCGSTMLDKEAVEVLSRASPFPRPPSDLTELSFNFALPIRFQMKK